MRTSRVGEIAEVLGKPLEVGNADLEGACRILGLAAADVLAARYAEACRVRIYYRDDLVGDIANQYVAHARSWAGAHIWGRRQTPPQRRPAGKISADLPIWTA